MSCSHNNTLSFGCKSSDGNWWTLPSGQSDDGYVPGFFSESGNGGGDYVDLNICIDCHVVLNLNEKAVLDADFELKKKAIINKLFDDFLTAEEVGEQTGLFLAEVEEISKALIKEGHIRYVTTDDCQVFDEGAMTSEYEYEELFGY